MWLGLSEQLCPRVCQRLKGNFDIVPRLSINTKIQFKSVYLFFLFPIIAFITQWERSTWSLDGQQAHFQRKELIASSQTWSSPCTPSCTSSLFLPTSLLCELIAINEQVHHDGVTIHCIVCCCLHTHNYTNHRLKGSKQPS
jgi:hypothetical protein